MNASVFASMVLKEIENLFPFLYEQHIKGREDDFIKEHSPPKAEMVTGTELGYVNEKVRFLWALSRMLIESGNKRCVNDGRAVLSSCRIASGISRAVVGKLCEVAFWELIFSNIEISERGKHAVFVRHDWSIVLAIRDDVTKTSEKLPNDPQNTLFEIISTVATVGNMLDEVVCDLGNGEVG